MGTAPLDAVFADGIDVNKDTLRAALQKVSYDYGTVANFRNYNLDNTLSVLIAGVTFIYDPTDTTTADNGVSCIVDLSGVHRFKKSVAGSSGGFFLTTSASASGNAPAFTTNGMAMPNATAQLIIATPAVDCTGAVAATFDGSASIAVVSPLGNALASGEWRAGISYLLSVTNSQAKIIFSGATW